MTSHYLGEPQFYGKWTSITSSKGFDANLVTIPTLAKWYARYTTGATAALVHGELLTGGTSSSTIRLLVPIVDTGTAGSSDTGILLATNSKSAAFQAETLTGGTSTGTVAIAEDWLPVNYSGMTAKSARVWVEGGGINYTLDGSTPTISSGANPGLTLLTGEELILEGDAIRKFKCIDDFGSTVLKYAIFF